MDAYLDSLIQVVHSVFKGAICESGVPHSHYAKYHNLNRGKYVCECDNYAISDVTTMDLTTYIWLDDVHLTYQEMYAANLPCDETMIIILTALSYISCSNTLTKYPSVKLFPCSSKRYVQLKGTYT